MMWVMWNFPTMSVQWCFGILQRIVSDLAMYDDGRGIQLDYLIRTNCSWSSHIVS